MTEFQGVVPPLASALNNRGYTELTPVQTAMLAPELDGADALVSAQTGSGKTVAFGLALAATLLGDAEKFGRAETPKALIIAPTRELAMQVTRELEWLFAETGASIASCVGGMDMRNERRALERGVDIVVGTPGRLKDHITRRSLDMSGIRAVVLDEADEMLDLGFREDLEFILGSAPEERRTLMFSATVPRSITHLAKNYQKNAVRVQTTEERNQHIDIEYRAMTVSPSEREHAIINVLRYYEAKNALVFCGTRAMVNHLTARFNNRGFSVVALSGELSQNERSHALQAMRDGRARVCIATDVAARGLDLPGLELVIHADLPQNGETLLHRSGRTGRAGNKGVSAIIVPQNFRRKAERLLQNARVSATWAPPPSADDVTAKDNERLLGDPMLSEPVGTNDSAFVQQLVETHSPEQLAAAFVRAYRSRSSAPEELNVLATDTKKPAHQDFGESIWISLSVGRNQNAEPRWILPLLCRSGDITKQEIGAIRMQPEETHVQLAARCFDAFMKAIGADAQLEDNIRVTRMANPPKDGEQRPRSEHSAPRDRKPSGRRDRKPSSPEDRKPYVPQAGDKPEKKWAKPNSRPGKKHYSKSDGPNADRKPADRKSNDKPPYRGDKGKGKPTYEPSRQTSDRPSQDRSTQDRPTKRSDDKPAYKSDSKPDYKSKKKSPGGKPSYRAGDKPVARSGDEPVFRAGKKSASGKPYPKSKGSATRSASAKPPTGKLIKARDPSVSLRQKRTKTRK